MLHLRPYVAFGFAAALLLAGRSVEAADPAEISWRTDYNAARKEAQEKNLPLLLVVGSDNCIYCRKQDASTFRDPTVISLLRHQFIPLKIDGSQEPALIQALRIQVYPTTVLAAPDGKIVGFLQGYVSSEQLREQARRSGFGSPGEAVVRNPERAPMSADRGRPRIVQARDLLAAARAEFQGERYAECLDKCDLIAVEFADLPEGKEARDLADQVKTDPQRLATACEQRNERTASLYLTLADTWIQKGEPREAQTCLEKILRLSPKGRLAELAQGRLASLKRSNPLAVPAGFQK